MLNIQLLKPSNSRQLTSKSFGWMVVVLPLLFLTITGCTTPQLPTPSNTAPPETITSLPTTTPANTPTQTQSPAPTITSSPAPSPTPAWVWNPPGEVIAPILLYHHIQDVNPASRFYVSLNDFELQMQSLLDWGYTPILPSLLVEAILFGAYLPPRPIVITFDDGHLDVYQNAYPIMDQLGISGIMYVVSNRIDEVKGFINIPQYKEMLASGWELGSHGISHSDLTLSQYIVRREVLQSRLDLEEAFSVSINTFAYPFGLVDDFVWKNVKQHNYSAAMGLGKTWTHNLGSLYYLSRIEIHGNTDLNAFGNLLPWASAP